MCVFMCVCARVQMCMCVLCSYVSAHAFILIFMDASGQHQVSLLLPLCITFGVSLSQILEGTSSRLTASVSP